MIFEKHVIRKIHEIYYLMFEDFFMEMLTVTPAQIIQQHSPILAFYRKNAEVFQCAN